MVCIYCDSSTSVINSRLQKRLNQVWRRRRCESCGSIFTTHETAGLDTSVVVKRAQQLEPFNRDLLFISVYESCKHRPSAAEDASALVQTVVSFLRQQLIDGTLSREQITETVSGVLERFDVSAATIYNAYHPTHADVAKS